MSLGQTTKNDLSFNLAKLDHGAMLTTAQMAMHLLEERCESHLRRLHERHDKRKGPRCYYLDAQYLVKTANTLAIAAETCYTLEESLTRDELEIVNKPEVPSEV